MSTNLSPEVAKLIAHEVALGRYKNESEVLTEAVQLLSQRNALRELVAAGSRQLAGGDFTEYDSQTLRRRLEDLKAGKSASFRRDA